jgi:FlaA1/EpsC-like NDP-sugar epimerase
MLEMGKPVSILELAERMIRLSGYRVGADIAIDIIGARPGEKIDEELTAGGEELLSTAHAAVYRLQPAALASQDLDMALLQLDECLDSRDSESARRSLFAMAGSAALFDAVVDEVAV